MTSSVNRTSAETIRRFPLPSHQKKKQEVNAASETEAAHRERQAAFTFTLLLAGAQTRPWRPTLTGGLGGQTPASCSVGLNQIKALLSWMNASHAFLPEPVHPTFQPESVLGGQVFCQSTCLPDACSHRWGSVDGGQGLMALGMALSWRFHFTLGSGRARCMCWALA